MRSYLSGFSVIVAVALALSAIAGESIAQSPRQREAPSGQREAPPGASLVGDAECLGVPQCVSRRSSVETLHAGEQLTIDVECTGTNGYAWHWDPQQHGHIKSSLQQRTPTRVTVLAQNVASIDGSIMVFVGCSTEPFDAVRAAARRPRPAKARHRELLTWPPPGGSVCDAWEIPGEGSPAVPQCIPVTQAPVYFKGWHSHVISYPCTADYPHYWPPHYTWDNSCFSCVDWTVSPPPPNELSLQCTNWCGGQTIQVTSACSKLPFDDGCKGAVTLTSDPGCPKTNEKTHCAGIPEVCFINWNETCSVGQYAGYEFSCTADNGFLFCTGCNGP